MRSTRLVYPALLLLVALLGAGCGSDEKGSSPTITLLPNAQTPDEWAGRIVNRLMRPMNRDLQVLSTLDDPQIKIYILEANPETLRIIDNRMKDLGKCSDRLIAIGPPPSMAGDIRQLRRVDGALHEACPHYVNVADVVLEAVDLMSSGRDDVVERGEKKLAEAGPDSKAAADAYAEAIRLAAALDEFKLHGLKPPA
jgi:hypothetical protein